MTASREGSSDPCASLYRDYAVFICGDMFSSLEERIRDALDSADFEWKSFNFETILPNSVLIREEEFLHLSRRSIKAALNEFIAGYIEKSAGKPRSIEMPDAFFSFNFKTNRFKARPAPLFIFGRYKKEAGISQSIWLSEGKPRYLSVEQIVGERARELFKGRSFRLHASGREDVDVANRAGRPFVLELSEARKRSDAYLLNGSFGGVEVSDAKFVPAGAVALVSDSHFDKVYKAKLDQAVEPFFFENIKLSQRTPERVRHRRADILRKRTIIYAKSLGPDEVEIKAEAGTYIKEFISGDNGRTRPSLSDLVGKRLGCIALEVERIDDYFLKHLGL